MDAIFVLLSLIFLILAVALVAIKAFLVSKRGPDHTPEPYLYRPSDAKEDRE